VEDKVLGDPTDPKSLSTKFRRRRDIRLRGLIGSISSRLGAVRILDMGGTVEYWQRVGFEFLRDQNANVTLLNVRDSALTEVGSAHDIFCKHIGDACRLIDFADGQFDLAHSNSVIEHVQTWSNMKAFASETRRVAKHYYVQTPYFWFPIDPHYYRMPLFHWLPRPTRARLLNLLPISSHWGRIKGVDLAFEVVDDARLLDARQFRFLFPEATIIYERFAGLTKSMIATGTPGLPARHAYPVDGALRAPETRAQ
jgi:hypothetical protein